jgi:Type I phosphodiesterase / nucleotide pyrophosphatase
VAWISPTHHQRRWRYGEFRILFAMAHLVHDLSVAKPDYAGGSIVNLMRSLGDACGARPSTYPPFAGIDARLRDAERIVLLIIDGLGAELLRAIGRQTVFSAHQCGTMSSVYPPTTATAITTFMTGLAPQQHGLTGWFMYFRRLGAVTAVLPFVPRYGRESLAACGVEMGSLIDCPSFFDAIDRASIALLPEAIAGSDFSRLLGGRARRLAYGSLEDFTAKLRACCEGREDARYVYAYWSDLDRLSHAHGPSSAVVAAHLADLDAALTTVFEGCAGSGTVLVATADHGFIDSGVGERVDLADHPDLADLLSLPLCGEPRSAYCYVRPGCTAAFEQYVTGELAKFVDLVPSEQLLDEGWFGRGDVHPEFTARIGDYTLQMRGRFTIRDRVTGEREVCMNGVHGGAAAAELYVPLILAGP